MAEKDTDVIGLHIYLGGVDNLEEMVRRIFEGLLRDSINRPWYDKVKKFLGNHVKQIDLFGVSVEFSATKQELQHAVNNFLSALQNLYKELRPEKKGILIILDDINGLASSNRFANWLKSFVDECATARNPIPISLVLVGLPERRYDLIKQQRSLDRVFNIITIEKFNEKETREFFINSFRKVNMEVKKEAFDGLTLWSGGYPVFMHELGDATFKVDNDNIIDFEDARSGIARGAMIIGAKYIEPNVLQAIHSKDYKNMLNKIAQGPLGYRFTRKDAITKLNPKEVKVFDNFIRRMEKLGVICKEKESGSGCYRFYNDMYFLFFALQPVVSLE